MPLFKNLLYGFVQQKVIGGQMDRTFVVLFSSELYLKKQEPFENLEIAQKFDYWVFEFQKISSNDFP